MDQSFVAMVQRRSPIARSRVLIGSLLLPFSLWAQEPDDTRTTVNEERDSLYIAETEISAGRAKVLHAEPLYIDLIRDLGARKGEKEWNLGFGITDNLGYDAYEMLVEYEFAPMDRLGVEIETPFTFHGAQRSEGEQDHPPDRMESLKLAAQWTFLVSDPANLSLALGYIHELELAPFNSFGDPLVTGHVKNPFLVAAKRWGSNFHTLVYTGPQFASHLEDGTTFTTHAINTNFHYMIPGTRNFIGLELNKTSLDGDFDMTLRPQMRLGIAENFLIGIVSGIPVNRENERFSMFARMIWEPGHKH